MSGELLPSVLKVVSNRIRRNTVQLLNEERRTYLELLVSCGLDADRHCGWFNYHLGVLLDEGVIAKNEDQYLLTDYGRAIARLLKTMEGESHRLFTDVTPMKKELLIDSHNCLDSNPDSPSFQTADVLVKRLDKYGFDMSTIMPNPSDTFSKIEEPNNLILEAMKNHPKRFFGFCFANPLFTHRALEEIERCLNLGFKGIGEITLDLYQASTDLTTIVKATVSLIRNIRNSDIPILFHVGAYHYSEPKTIEGIISELPEKTIIMGHMGSMKHLLDEVISVAKRHENVYLDTAFAFLDREMIDPEKDDPATWSPSPDSYLLIRKAISELGPERIIFGSVSFNDEQMQRELKKIEALNLTVKERKLIMGGNLARILKLKH